METVKILPQKHIFVCVNERSHGDCCMKANGMDVFKRIKEFVLLHGMASSVWVTKTGCLGFCNPIGTTVAIYPEQNIYSHVKLEDVERVLENL